MLPGRSRCLLLAAALPLAMATTACGSAGAGSEERGKLHVIASFYPLQWVTERVAGPGAEVSSLTPPGAEPHDLELVPRDVATLAEADLVVYLGGFQPAVDDAVAQEANGSALDVAGDAHLRPADTGEEHADDGHSEEGNAAGGRDPHFWLDPTRLADVADAVATQLGTARRAQSEAFVRRAGQVRADLEALDREMAQGLAGCEGTDLVTSHAAFGYLAERYGMSQVGISGLSPDAEPSPRDVADVAAFVAEHEVRTIYYETLVSPDVARTVARETGATTAVLDPLEGITDDSPGDDYLEVMQANVQTLREGQPCR
jgi:zinc transport system substrate-binding protein